MSLRFDWSIARAMQAYQLMRVGAAVLTGVVLAKSGLSTADIGIWEMLLYLGSFVVFLGVNGLLQGIALYHVQHADKGNAFIFNALWTFGAIGLLFSSILYLGATWIVPALTGRATLPWLGWYCTYLLLSIPTLPLEIYYMIRQRSLALTIWGLTGFGGYLVVLGAAVWSGWGLGLAIQILTVLAALRAVWVFVEMGWPPKPDGSISAYWKLSWPLVINSLQGTLIGWFDPWLVAWWYADPALFAIFRYGSREFPLALALATGLGTAMTYNIGQDRAAGMAELRRRGMSLMHIVLPLSAVLIIMTPYLFPIVFNADFIAAIPLFQVMLLVTLSRVLLPNSVLVGIGDTKSVAQIGTMELALKIGAGYYFNAYYGIMGVVVSFVLCCFFEKIALAWLLWRRHGVHPRAWLDVRWYSFYVLLLGVILVFTLQ
jgi:O-antigen/teichoic acid export membrane protein